MADRRCAPEALFVRHLETTRHQGVTFLGLLFLLTPSSDPKHQAAALTPRLGPLDALPSHGAVMPLWSDDTDTWDCDSQALAEMRGQLDAAAAMLVAIVKNTLEEQQVVYWQLPDDVVAEIRAGISETLGEAMN